MPFHCLKPVPKKSRSPFVLPSLCLRSTTIEEKRCHKEGKITEKQKTNMTLWNINMTLYFFT